MGLFRAEGSLDFSISVAEDRNIVAQPLDPVRPEDGVSFTDEKNQPLPPEDSQLGLTLLEEPQQKESGPFGLFRSDRIQPGLSQGE